MRKLFYTKIKPLLLSLIPLCAASLLPTPVAAVSESPIYRLYNPNSGEHLYTASKKEYDYNGQHGWNQEGIGWNAPAAGSPVYRLYNPNNPYGDHHYTMDQNEYEALGKLGWIQEGVKFYSAGEDGAEIYRLYNPNAEPSGKSGSHHLTSALNERDYLFRAGWNYESVGFRASSLPGSAQRIADKLIGSLDADLVYDYERLGWVVRQNGMYGLLGYDGEWIERPAYQSAGIWPYGLCLIYPRGESYDPMNIGTVIDHNGNKSAARTDGFVCGPASQYAVDQNGKIVFWRSSSDPHTQPVKPTQLQWISTVEALDNFTNGSEPRNSLYIWNPLTDELFGPYGEDDYQRMYQWGDADQSRSLRIVTNLSCAYQKPIEQSAEVIRNGQRILLNRYGIKTITGYDQAVFKSKQAVQVWKDGKFSMVNENFETQYVSAKDDGSLSLGGNCLYKQDGQWYYTKYDHLLNQ